MLVYLAQLFQVASIQLREADRTQSLIYKRALDGRVILQDGIAGTISHLSASCSSRFLRDGEFTVLVYFILKVHFFFPLSCVSRCC